MTGQEIVYILLNSKDNTKESIPYHIKLAFLSDENLKKVREYYDEWYRSIRQEALSSYRHCEQQDRLDEYEIFESIKNGEYFEKNKGVLENQNNSN